MVGYEEYKAANFADAATVAEHDTSSVLKLLKSNAVLVELATGHKSLAEDIFANALEIERALTALVG